MTSPSAFLYRYTPGSVGIVLIFACRSMEAVLLFYWMGTQRSVLQKGQMRYWSPRSSRTSLGRKLAKIVLLMLCGPPVAVPQSTTSAPQDQSSQPHITKSEA